MGNQLTEQRTANTAPPVKMPNGKIGHVPFVQHIAHTDISEYFLPMRGNQIDRMGVYRLVHERGKAPRVGEASLFQRGHLYYIVRVHLAYRHDSRPLKSS